MAWTYYKESFANGRWMLFRSADGHRDESYHLQKGWIKTDLLLDRQRKGDIDASDAIPEREAKKLIEGVAKTA